MDSVYLFRNGVLKRKHDTLLIEDKKKKKTYFPVNNVSDIKVFSEVTINKRLLEFLTRKQIPVFFFNHFGHYTGAYVPIQHNTFGSIILKQADYYSDKEKRLFIAKQFVYGAAENMLKNMMYYINQQKEIKKEQEAIESSLKDIHKAKSVEQLMSKEAQIRKWYYKFFDKVVKHDEFKLKKRKIQPPGNYMNALISYGNSLLYLSILTEILKTPLDPRISYLHATNFRRYSLNLDFSEIFKPLIVDRTILALVNRNQMKLSDFEPFKGGIYLNDGGRKKIVEEYEKRLKKTITIKSLKRKASFRKLIRTEAYKLIKHMNGEAYYEPFIIPR